MRRGRERGINVDHKAGKSRLTLNTFWKHKGKGKLKLNILVKN